MTRGMFSSVAGVGSVTSIAIIGLIANRYTEYVSSLLNTTKDGIILFHWESSKTVHSNLADSSLAIKIIRIALY